MRLKELRKKKGYSQQQVANKLKITQQAYANYEAGKREPDVNSLLILSEVFEVTLDYLLGKTDSPELPVQILEVPAVLDDFTVAFHRGAFEDLTQDEVDKLAEFAEFIKSQRAKKQ
jgi:transcriptional regulator with XRE-family HTH domain